eukprot:scaffold6563_cov107-Cyclotella_meneghiniana.AAC.1
MLAAVKGNSKSSAVDSNNTQGSLPASCSVDYSPSSKKRQLDNKEDTETTPSRDGREATMSSIQSPNGVTMNLNNDDPNTWSKSKKKRMRLKRKKMEAEMKVMRMRTNGSTDDVRPTDQAATDKGLNQANQSYRHLGPENRFGSGTKIINCEIQ